MVSLGVKLLTLDTAPNTVFLVWFFLSAPHPLGSCYQLWCSRQACVIGQFGPYCDTGPTGLSVADVHRERRVSSPAHKDISEGPNYYGLYYKCVSKHFIINWNLAS